MIEIRRIIIIVCIFIAILSFSVAIALDEGYQLGYKDGTEYGKSLGYIECQAEKVPVECFPQWEEGESR